MNICRIVILDLPKLERIKTGSDSFRELQKFSLSSILCMKIVIRSSMSQRIYNGSIFIQ